MIGMTLMYVFLFVSLYFEIFMLVSFIRIKIEQAFEEPREGARNFEPSVAIVVPCFNEAKTVAGTLQSLLALDYPNDKLEIIVVDDGSRDDARGRADI